jgi:hypothetical protein
MKRIFPKPIKATDQHAKDKAFIDLFLFGRANINIKKNKQMEKYKALNNNIVNEGFIIIKTLDRWCIENALFKLSVGMSKVIDSAIENNIGWFEKIEEKTYEILEQNPTLVPDISKPIIKKVKRLSDGEIFSVGDKVHDKYDKTMAVIKNFSFNKEGNLMVCSDYVLPLKGSWCRVLDERIIKESVKTEDGKDVYGGVDCFSGL